MSVFMVSLVKFYLGITRKGVFLLINFTDGYIIRDKFIDSNYLKRIQMQ